MSRTITEYVHKHPLICLTISFLLWRAFIAALVIISPGIGYDTSTSLIEDSNFDHELGFGELPSSLGSRWLNFARWDAFFYTHSSIFGLVYEQDWAFGLGYPFIVRWLSPVWPHSDPLIQAVRAGAVISHCAHYLSTILLWDISRLISENGDHGIPVVAALLHIMSPAGVFLSAPYSESLFSFLNMLGFYLYVRSYTSSQRARIPLTLILLPLAGFAFGCGATIRSNGIFSGLSFLFDAINIVVVILNRGLSLSRLARLFAVCLGGFLVGFGAFIPQFLAYQQYCAGRNGKDRRPWCDNTIPSIYTWVQSHYWGVGFLRYWRFPNLPLFAMALPSLWLLIMSAIDIFRDKPATPDASPRTQLSSQDSLRKRRKQIIAMPQLLLALLAITNYHVQVITRLSSGYPLWYHWLAASLVDKNSKNKPQFFVRWMMIYALIQAFLFGSFLPPA